VAPEDIVPGRAANGRKRRFNFFLNPATRTLEIHPDAGAIIEKALMRALGCIKLRLYIRFASLYFAKLRFQRRGWTLHSLGLVGGFFR